MNLKGFINSVNRIKAEKKDVDKSLIQIYLEQNEIQVKSLSFLADYLDCLDTKVYEKIKNNISKYKVLLDINNLIEIFELVIPVDEGKENGMVYTPYIIKDYIIKNLLKDYNGEKTITICDPACGCGSFLVSVAQFLNSNFNIKYSEIFRDILYGVDIVPHNADKAKVLLAVLALSDGEIIKGDIFNIKAGNSLEMNWQDEFPIVFNNGGFNYILGNPPYVRTKNMNDDVRLSLRKWKTSQSGNPDLYIAFYELAITILNPNGEIGYISINTFLKSVNGRGLRKLLIEKAYNMKIIDFKDFQIFKNVTSYTCIVLIDKKNIDNHIFYATCTDIKYLDTVDFNTISFDELPTVGAWNLLDYDIKTNIEKIENIGEKLGKKYKIRNGLATLKNDIYIFKPIKETDNYYVRVYNNCEYLIEKNICLDIIKPNIIKNEDDLEKLMEKVIFPYRLENGISSIINEAELIEKYPKAYEYLLSVKEELSKRDKGKGNYAAWYAFGRTQGLNNFGSKIFVPYMAGKPIAVMSNSDNVLFYCGYAIFVEDTNEKKSIKKILESDVFWYYIKNTSKPYENGFMSLAKNYITNFGIPDLTVKQKEYIIQENSKEKLNKFLFDLYDIA